MKNQKFLTFLTLISLLSLPLICGAVNVAPITNVLNNVIQAAILIVAAICTIMIIWGGIVMLTAAGAADKVATGRQIILWSVIGLVVALMASAITAVVQSLV
jgi:hypothetical protein